MFCGAVLRMVKNEPISSDIVVPGKPITDHFRKLRMFSNIRNAGRYFMDRGVLFKWHKEESGEEVPVLCLPKALTHYVIPAAHGHILSGHDGCLKTLRRIN